jgi:hypothetical protein
MDCWRFASLRAGCVPGWKRMWRDGGKNRDMSTDIEVLEINEGGSGLPPPRQETLPGQVRKRHPGRKIPPEPRFRRNGESGAPGRPSRVSSPGFPVGCKGWPAMPQTDIHNPCRQRGTRMRQGGTAASPMTPSRPFFSLIFHQDARIYRHLMRLSHFSC